MFSSKWTFIVNCRLHSTIPMKIKGRTVIREHPRFCCITQKQRENLPDKQIAQNMINKKMVTFFCMFDELCISRKMRCGHNSISYYKRSLWKILDELYWVSSFIAVGRSVFRLRNIVFWCAVKISWGNRS